MKERSEKEFTNGLKQEKERCSGSFHLAVLLFNVKKPKDKHMKVKTADLEETDL